MSEKIGLALAIAGIAGVAVLAYILLTRRAYGATTPYPPTQPSPPQQPQPPSQPEANVEIFDYEVY
jgi:hypothetical protein